MLIKLSKRQVQEDELIAEMREKAKQNPAVIKEFKEYGVSLGDIDNIPVEFVDLDVSAKTKNRKIYINKALLGKQNPTHYFVHECIHYAQQKTGNSDDGSVSEYIDKPTEVEAFKAQVDFKKRQDGPKQAEKYVKDLVDYHGLKGKEKTDKQKELLGKK